MTFGRTERWQRMLLLEATFALLRARVRLLIMPFREVAREIGTLTSPHDPSSNAETEIASVDTAIIRNVGWAVRTMAGFVPFKAVCLQQAIAAHAMLKRRGIASVMHFGAIPGGFEHLQAHAWVDAAGIKVTGYPMAPDMREIGRLIRHQS